MGVRYHKNINGAIPKRHSAPKPRKNTSVRPAINKHLLTRGRLNKNSIPLTDIKYGKAHLTPPRLNLKNRRPYYDDADYGTHHHRHVNMFNTLHIILVVTIMRQ